MPSLIIINIYLSTAWPSTVSANELIATYRFSFTNILGLTSLATFPSPKRFTPMLIAMLNRKKRKIQCFMHNSYLRMSLQ